MNLHQHYEELYQSSIKKIKADDYFLDTLIDSSEDRRFGISLLIRPPEHITKKISLFLKELEEIENQQYFYPETDLHITVLSIISCYQDFKLANINPVEYAKVIAESLNDFRPFHNALKGITASDAGVMLQGFPEKSLNLLRDELRQSFRKSSLEQSIDKRYSLQTAHITVMRFKEKLNQKEMFLNKLKELKNHDFGNFEVNKMELVFNDWYQRKRNTKLLGVFRLKK